MQGLPAGTFPRAATGVVTLWLSHRRRRRRIWQSRETKSNTKIQRPNLNSVPLSPPSLASPKSSWHRGAGGGVVAGSLSSR